MSIAVGPESQMPAVSASGVGEAPRFVRRLLRRPVALACVLYLSAIVGVAIIAPIALPGVASQYAGSLTAAHQGPTLHHLLGTDTLGRDVLERLLVGTRVTMVGVAEALVVLLVLGVPLGLAAGFYGGWIDRVVSWCADLAFAIPAIVLILVVLAVFPASMLAAMVTFGVLAAPGLMRVVRAATLPIRQELYIAAAQVSGLSRPYVITRHVLPRIAGVVIIQAALLSALALLVQTGLAFLGLVVASPAPSWGGMVADGASVIQSQSWLIWPPGMVIAITILAFGLLGDSVRDASTEAWSAPVRSVRRRRRVRAVRGLPATASDRDACEPGRPPTSAFLSIEHLVVTFPGHDAAAVKVVDDVTFDVGEGETVGLLGESGCGKSVTAMSILGLLPGAGKVESGRIVFGGHDLAHVDEREIRRVRGKEIALVSQEPMVSLDPAFRIGAQLTEAVRRHGSLTRAVAKRRALELLSLVQIPAPDLVARRYPHEISGGMAQRVAIARALAGSPRLLIADEPTTALDVTVQAEILALLRDLQADTGMAILLVTHDWGVVADMCDRAVVMYAGEVVERATVTALFDAPLHPYTAALLASNPNNADGAEMLPTIPGSVPQPGSWPSGCHFHPRCARATAACTERPISLETPMPDRETRCIHYDELMRLVP